MQLLNMILAVLLVMAVGCASKRKVEEVDNSDTISRDFEVRDASSNFRPAWIEDAEAWAEQEEKEKGYRWFAC